MDAKRVSMWEENACAKINYFSCKYTREAKIDAENIIILYHGNSHSIY